MKKFLFCFIFISACLDGSFAQSYAFGVKGGLSMGTQSWNGFERDPLFRYHGALFIESAPEDDKYALFAQLGYHVKGTAQRFRRFFFRDPNDPGNPEGIEIGPRTDNVEFGNLSLIIGAKQKFDLGLFSRAYYSLGIRGDYNLTRSFDGFFAIYDNDELVNRFTAGLTVGGGVEIPFGEFVRGIVEVSVSPDVTKQLFLPRQNNTGYFYPDGRPFVVQEQNVTNVLFELSLGLRFLHRIVYVD